MKKSKKKVDMDYNNLRETIREEAHALDVCADEFRRASEAIEARGTELFGGG